MKRALVELRRQDHRLGVIDPAIGGRLASRQQGDRHLRTPTHILRSAIRRPLSLNIFLDRAEKLRIGLAGRNQRQRPVQLRTQITLRQISTMPVNVVDCLTRLGSVIGGLRPTRC